MCWLVEYLVLLSLRIGLVMSLDVVQPSLGTGVGLGRSRKGSQSRIRNRNRSQNKNKSRIRSKNRRGIMSLTIAYPAFAPQ